MMGLRMLIPTNEIEKVFSDKLEIYQRKIEVLQKQIDGAKNARDRLLPKLMNGEIEI